EGHSPVEGLASNDARSQDYVIHLVSDHTGHRGHPQRGVLIVGVKHDDHVGSRGKSGPRTGVLVASIAVVASMSVDFQAKALGQFYGFVGTVVVDQDATVHQLGDFTDGGFQSLLRVVGGHDHRYALAVDHRAFFSDELVTS